jgi:4-amino-4-deoxy-L-arabinose transferase-like glycosyltransferase
MSAPDPAAPNRDSLSRHALIVLALCIPVFWIGLSQRGFADTEGHRVVPGWELLEKGWGSAKDGGAWALLVPRMFERVYVRKPPGMPWAIAGMARVLGESEFSARAVSALATTLLALGSLFFARRWLGPSAGLAAGIVAALTPGLVASGRTAEIEALNNLCAFVSVCLVIELLFGARSAARGRLISGALAFGAALAILATILVKGPAGLPVIAATGACAWWRAGRSIARGTWLLVAIVLAGGAAWVLYVLAQRAIVASGQTPIRQGVSEFLWGAASLTPARVLKAAEMPLVALASALPASLAPLALGRRWAPALTPGRSIARALIGGCLLSLLGMALAGVSNPRYALPSMAALPLIAGWAWSARPDSLRRGAWKGLERGIVIALLLACIGLGPVRDGLRSPTNSGRLAGIELGKRLAESSELTKDTTIFVSASDAIEARPETLLYLAREARARRVNVRPVWGGIEDVDFMLVRTDAESGERALLERPTRTHGTIPVRVGEPVRVHRYEFTLVRCYPLPGD